MGGFENNIWYKKSFLNLHVVISIAILALGSQPRQRLARMWANRSVRECEDENSHSQMSSHFGSWSPGGLPNFRRTIVEIKMPHIEKFFISLESCWSVDV
jgi:hypothetical protein